MRVAIVAGPYVPVPPPKYGGTEQVIYYLIKGLKELGHQPVLFGTGDSSLDCEIIPIVERAIYFPKTTAELPEHNRLVKTINQRTDRLLRRNLKGLDIIHSHGFDLKDFAYFPNVTTMHTKVGLEEMRYFMKRKNLNYISISKNQQEAFPSLKYMGVVYNGEDPAQFPFVAEPEDYVCFLGRFDKDKNPHLAIELAINLGIKIKVAGKIDHLGDNYFKEEVAKYLNHPLVEYLGEVDFEQKVELLSHAKCNLHPTGFREPFGLTVIEAAYCGTPTLAIERGAMPELIEHGKTGLVVEDFVEGFHQIERCFKMDRIYTATRARQLFNYRGMTQGYLNSYRRAIAEHAPAKPALAKLRQIASYPALGWKNMLTTYQTKSLFENYDFSDYQPGKAKNPGRP